MLTVRRCAVADSGDGAGRVDVRTGPRARGTDGGRASTRPGRRRRLTGALYAAPMALVVVVLFVVPLGADGLDVGQRLAAARRVGAERC